MSILKEKIGVNKEGKDVTKYTLKNHNGMEVALLDLGAVIYSIMVPDRDGVFENVTLGYEKLESYEVNMPGFGAPVGRYANRISNAKFELNGKEYQLDQNDVTNCLHGGNVRYNRFMYEVECQEGMEEDSVSFSRVSPDGEQGFPGNLTLTMTYTLTDDNELLIRYYAVSDEDTIINLTNHAYFNLGKGGESCKDIYEQEIQVAADYYTPVDEILIPTGELKSVDGTALDFREFKKVKEGLGEATPDESIVSEYDHNFVLKDYKPGEVSFAAAFRDAQTGRLMEVYTDQPGIQLYTAGKLTEPGGRNGVTYGRFTGACFETQNFPNAINTPNFPNSVLKAGEEFDSLTVFRFSTFE